MKENRVAFRPTEHVVQHVMTGQSSPCSLCSWRQDQILSRRHPVTFDVDEVADGFGAKRPSRGALGSGRRVRHLREERGGGRGGERDGGGGTCPWCE